MIKSLRYYLLLNRILKCLILFCNKQVNSVNLRSATHEDAIQALRQTTNVIRMVILRREMINEEDKFDIITVDFTKKAGKGLGKKNKLNRTKILTKPHLFLGFSIIGRRHGFGVFISHIVCFSLYIFSFLLFVFFVCKID